MPTMSLSKPISDHLLAEVLKLAAMAWGAGDQNAIAATEVLMQDAFSPTPLLTPKQRAEALSFLGLNVQQNSR